MIEVTNIPAQELREALMLHESLDNWWESLTLKQKDNLKTFFGGVPSPTLKDIQPPQPTTDTPPAKVPQPGVTPMELTTVGGKVQRDRPKTQDTEG